VYFAGLEIWLKFNCTEVKLRPMLFVQLDRNKKEGKEREKRKEQSNREITTKE
jgi:hypothetical protein